MRLRLDKYLLSLFVMQTVKPYRVRRLHALYKHNLHSGQMVRPLFSLIQLFDQYDSSTLLPPPPKSSLGYTQFVHVDDDWSQHIQHLRDVASSTDETLLRSDVEGNMQIIDFKLPTQLHLSASDHVHRRRFHVRFFSSFDSQWPSSQGSAGKHVESSVTIDQLNSPRELVAALRSRRVHLIVPCEYIFMSDCDGDHHH